MGITNVKISIANPAKPEEEVILDFLVDSGATFSVVPERVLKKLGIKPHATEDFALANGHFITRERGLALFRLDERIGGAEVVFGKRGDATLLGAHTLEALGLALDPLKRLLRPLPMMLA